MSDLCIFKQCIKCGQFWHDCHEADYIDLTEYATETDIDYPNIYCIYCNSCQDCFCCPCNNIDCKDCNDADI